MLVELCLDLLLDPSMCEGFFCRDSLLWVLLHESLDQVLDLWALVTPVLWFELKYASANFSNNLIIIRSTEGWSTAHHNIQNDTNAPQVAFFVIITHEDLWSDVVRCAIDLMHGVVFFVVCVRGTKINDFDCSFGLSIN